MIINITELRAKYLYQNFINDNKIIKKYIINLKLLLILPRFIYILYQMKKIY